MSLSAPTQITVPFASSGAYNTIPANADTTNGLAGYDLGFPPVTMLDKKAGGIPPVGQDFNGIFLAVTQAIRWLEAGGSFPYSSAFSTAVGGYPLGAVVMRSDGSGYWRNTVANNTTDPAAFGAGWVPDGSGVATVAMTNANVTLTALQAANPIIVISGTLTANLNLIFPTWGKSWLIINNATGAYSVTCKTTSGSGITVATGANALVYGDGANIASAAPTVASATVTGTKNLKITYTGTSATVTITAEEAVLQTSAGSLLRLTGISVTASSGAAAGINSLDTGSWAYSTWYYSWLVYNPTTALYGIVWSLSSTSPTLPSGYTYYVRLGANKTQSSANYNFLSGVQTNRRFQLKVGSTTNVTALPVIASSNTGGTWVSASLASFVPATALRVQGSVSVNNAASSVAAVAPNGSYGSHLSTSNPPPCMVLPGTGSGFGSNLFDFVLETVAVYYYTTTSASLVQLLGWEDA